MHQTHDDNQAISRPRSNSADKSSKKNTVDNLHTRNFSSSGESKDALSGRYVTNNKVPFSRGISITETNDLDLELETTDTPQPKVR